MTLVGNKVDLCTNNANDSSFEFNLVQDNARNRLFTILEESKSNYTSANQTRATVLLTSAMDLSDTSNQQQDIHEMADIYAKQHQMAYFETSAKTGQGVPEMMQHVMKQAYLKRKKLLKATD